MRASDTLWVTGKARPLSARWISISDVSHRVCWSIYLVLLFILLLLDYVLETFPCIMERGFSVGNLALVIISIRSREAGLLFFFSVKFESYLS